jgi:hypothetical protein
VTVKGYLGVLHYMKLEKVLLNDRDEHIKPGLLVTQTNFSLATRFLEFCVERLPDNAYFIHHLGKLYMLNDRTDRCEQLFNSFRQTEGLLPQSHIQYLKLLLAKTRAHNLIHDKNSVNVQDDHLSEKIVSTCEDILRIDPINFLALNTLKQMYSFDDTNNLREFFERLWSAIEYLGVSEGSEMLWSMLADIFAVTLSNQNKSLFKHAHDYAQSFIDFTKLDSVIISHLSDDLFASPSLCDQTFSLFILTMQNKQRCWNFTDCERAVMLWRNQHYRSDSFINDAISYINQE